MSAPTAPRGPSPAAEAGAGRKGPAAPEDALHRLLAERPMTAARWGLQRIEAMLDELGRPERTFRSLHIAGTNGKGSTAAFGEAILRAAGHRTALYTSPHLLDVRERFRAEGRELEEELLQGCAAALIPVADRAGATYFEATTALAFLAFAERGVEWAAVETGLGGRLDATNVLRPAACCLTQIAMDHTELLGSTLAQIAAEKAGILKPGVPAASVHGPGEVRRVLRERASGIGAPLAWLTDDPDVDAEARVTAVRVSRRGTTFLYASPRFPDGIALGARLIGRHQARNAAVATLGIEAALGDAAPLDAEAVREGVAAARIPGRLEWIERRGTSWIVDVAHNLAGLDTLLAALRELEPPRPHVFLTAILRDKRWRAMLERAGGTADALVLTAAPSAPEARRWYLPEVADWARRAAPRRAELVPDFDGALRRAAELSGGGTVVVTGSAHTAADALARLRPSGSPREAGTPPGPSDDPRETR